MPRSSCNIKKSDGTVKRVSIKRIQTAGATTAEIDREFEATSKRLSLVWNEENRVWRTEPDSWYDLLDVSPEYLAEKCAEQGLSKKETQDIIKTWGNRLFNTSVNPAEIHKINNRKADLPLAERTAHENYLNTTVKETERGAYQECKLNHRESVLPIIHKTFCEDLMCSPLPHEGVISNAEELESALRDPVLSADKKRKIRQCYSDGHVCLAKNYPQTYNREQFTHFRNGGAGDCLFIAFNNYMSMVREIGNYPDPMTDNSGMRRPVRPQDDKGAAHKLRMRAVGWLRDNLNLYLPSQDKSIKNELSILMAETAEYKVLKSEILRKFKQDHKPQYDALEPYLKDLTVILNNPEGLPPLIEPAFNMLMDVFAYGYLSHMEKPSTYAGQPEITALAMINEVDIQVLQRTSGNKLVTHFGYTKVRSPRGVVYLYHTQNVASTQGGLHFEVMFPIPENPRSQARRAPSSASRPPPVPLVLLSSDEEQEVKEVEEVEEVKVIEFTQEDNKFLSKLGFKIKVPTRKTIRDFLKVEKDKKLKAILKDNMQALGKLSETMQDLLYKFIEEHADDPALLRIPLLIIRGEPESNPVTNWTEGKLDKKLEESFRLNILNRCKELLDMAVEVPIDAPETISGRMRHVLAAILNEENNKVSPDDLFSLTVTEMFDIANDLIDHEDTMPVKAYFFKVFLESFYFKFLPIITALTKSNPNIPGVNVPANLQSVIDILKVFSGFLYLENN